MVRPPHAILDKKLVADAFKEKGEPSGPPERPRRRARRAGSELTNTVF